MTPQDDRNWQPATLRERGVAIPFTSPMLAGARARLADKRCDLLVPHPGGARGVYIFTLASLSEFCTPTMHDLRLAEQLARMQPLSPVSVRQAARGVAADGAAGRAAASAASEALAREREAAQRFESDLLQNVVCENADAAGLSGEQRAAQAICKLASRSGRDAETVKADIGLLSGVLAGAGLDRIRSSPDAGRHGRCTLLLGAIEAMRTGMLAWAETMGSNASASQVASVAVAMRVAGQRVLTTTQKLVEEADALIQAWATGPDMVTARLARPDWLLDGWEQLCLLWQVAKTDDERAEAAAEIAALLPPVPPEVDAWLGAAPELVARLRDRRPAPVSSARTARAPSQIVSLIARNECIRALAA